MNRIDRIIAEEINRFLFEDENVGSSKPQGADQYADELANANKSGELNIRKLASKISGIPTSTKNKKNVNRLNSVQSKLRKEIYGEKGSNGGTMHLHADEMSDIAQARND